MTIYTNHYYVYAYIRTNGTPYYIGKGKGNRAYSKNHSVWVPKKDSGQIIILESNLSEVGALAIERRLIRWWGKRHEGGLLYNKADGGEGKTGYSISRPHTEETKRKMSEAKMGKSYPRLTEANIKAGKKRRGLKLSEETRQKISKAIKGKVISDEHKANLFKAAIGKKHPVKSVTCPHCLKAGNPGAMARFHFDKCKFKP